MQRGNFTVDSRSPSIGNIGGLREVPLTIFIVNPKGLSLSNRRFIPVASTRSLCRRRASARVEGVVGR